MPSKIASSNIAPSSAPTASQDVKTARGDLIGIAERIGALPASGKVRDVYIGFAENMARIDSNPDLKESDKLNSKKEALIEGHTKIQGLTLKEKREFGEIIKGVITAHNTNDSRAVALKEGRVIFKSWHEPGRVAAANKTYDDNGHPHDLFDGGTTVSVAAQRVGADSLNIALDAKTFREYKNIKAIPLGAVPATVLKTNSPTDVFSTVRGTVTNLLPENVLTAFMAYNEAAKSHINELSGLSEKNLRDMAKEMGVKPREFKADLNSLKEQAKELRASTTRPELYKNDDIGSLTDAFHHKSKDSGEVWQMRKSYASRPEKNGVKINPLRNELPDKLSEDYRLNAAFYQTYTAANPATATWSEMTVKIRQSGNTERIGDMDGVFLEKADPEIKIVDGGGYDETLANAEKIEMTPLTSAPNTWRSEARDQNGEEVIIDSRVKRDDLIEKK